MLTVYFEEEAGLDILYTDLWFCQPGSSAGQIFCINIYPWKGKDIVSSVIKG